MSLFDFLCPGCGYKEEFFYNAPWQQKGRQVICPKCGTEMERLFPNTFSFRIYNGGEE